MNVRLICREGRTCNRSACQGVGCPLFLHSVCVCSRGIFSALMFAALSSRPGRKAFGCGDKPSAVDPVTRLGLHSDALARPLCHASQRRQRVLSTGCVVNSRAGCRPSDPSRHPTETGTGAQYPRGAICCSLSTLGALGHGTGLLPPCTSVLLADVVEDAGVEQLRGPHFP